MVRPYTGKPGGKPGGDSADSQGAVIDSFEFVRLARKAEGSVDINALHRVVEDLPRQPQGEAGRVHWQVNGETGEHGEPLLRLNVRANPVLICQRCLQPFVSPIDSIVRLQLVRTPEELDSGLGDHDHDRDRDDDVEETDDAGDGEPEKVLGSRRFNVLDQVEDELILSIPYVPRHAVCPDLPGRVESAAAAPEQAPSPFAVLEKLKRKN